MPTFCTFNKRCMDSKLTGRRKTSALGKNVGGHAGPFRGGRETAKEVNPRFAGREDRGNGAVDQITGEKGRGQKKAATFGVRKRSRGGGKGGESLKYIESLKTPRAKCHYKLVELKLKTGTKGVTDFESKKRTTLKKFD